MSCFIKKNISKLKFINFNFINFKINKFYINKEVFFDVINDSQLYKLNINSNLDILKSFYLCLINLQIDTSKNIKHKSPIIYNGNSCFEIEEKYINDNIIIREIFSICERNNIKLWIEINCKYNYLVYKDK